MVRKAALIALMFATPLAAENVYDQFDTWTAFWWTESGSTFYLETAKLRNASDQRPSIWMMGDYSKDKTTHYRKGYYRYEVDCQAARYRLVQSTHVFPNGTSESGNGIGYWEAAIPDSAFARLIERACPSKEPPEWLQSPVVG